MNLIVKKAASLLSAVMMLSMIVVANTASTVLIYQPKVKKNILEKYRIIK